MKSVRVKFIRNHEGIGAGETRIFDANTAAELIAIGVAVEMFEVKPVGPKEIKPTGPSEIKCLCIVGCSVNGICPVHGDEAFPVQGKKKVKTRKS